MPWWTTLYEGAKTYAPSLYKGAQYYFVAPLGLAGRIIFNTGQALFYMGKAADYCNFTPNIRYSTSSVAAIGTLSSTLLRNTVPIFQQFSYDAANSDDQPPLLGWPGRLTRWGLLSAGATYGLLTSLGGYLGTELVSEAIATLFKTDLHDPDQPWKEQVVQAAGIIVTVFYLTSYYSYDYQFIKKNVNIISQSVDQAQFVINRAMVKTLASSLLNFYVYPSQVFFTAGPSIEALPYVKDSIGTGGIQFLSGLAAGMTALTVITWLPSVYEVFANPPAFSKPFAQEPHTYFSWTIRASSYLTGAIDSVGCNGLGPGLSVILTLNKLTGKKIYDNGMTLYGIAVIGFGVGCGINAAIVNFSFSVLPGLDKLLKAIYTQPVEQYTLDVNNPSIQTLPHITIIDPEGHENSIVIMGFSEYSHTSDESEDEVTKPLNSQQIRNYAFFEKVNKQTTISPNSVEEYLTWHGKLSITPSEEDTKRKKERSSFNPSSPRLFTSPSTSRFKPFNTAYSSDSEEYKSSSSSGPK